VEPGREELALGRERAEAVGVDPERLSPGTGEALPYPDGSLSGALLHDVLEHVLDWRVVLRECRRVLEPGGVLYVKGPSYAWRFQEPHYRVPWLPMLPKPVARRYLRALGRDVGYLEHLGWRRRGAVIAELRGLGFELSFPRREKVADPERVNRPWARRLVQRFPRAAAAVADNPLQSAIDVVARVP
jgi:SAM-dependent methyltransferase